MNAPVDLKAFLEAQERKTLLRFLTCGSVDDGKSTLIGRLLLETGALFKDEEDSVLAPAFYSDLQPPDLARLLDGLKDEREQGITIDVAYRYFRSSRRRFILADCPGHYQYMRNLVCGAFNSDVALIMVDAQKGVSPQTRRHSYLLSMLAVRQVVFCE